MDLCCATLILSKELNFIVIIKMVKALAYIREVCDYGVLIIYNFLEIDWVMNLRNYAIFRC